MAKVTYIAFDGSETVIDVPAGMSLMQAALDHDIDGIVGECGGSAMCSTCHVYVAEEFLPLLPERSIIEDEMLEATAAERCFNSRLSCQLFATDEFDGLVVNLPESQLW